MTMTVIIILLLIVISNMLVRYLTIVSGGTIETNAILKIISLMLPKYIAYLLPISFFVAILLVCGKMFSNNELTIFFGCGNNWLQFLKIILIPAYSFFIIELLLTLLILPKMDQAYSSFKTTATKTSLINFVQPGKIISFNNDKQVIYTKSIGKNGILYDVFFYQEMKNNERIIITASKCYADNKLNKNNFLIFENGYFYKVFPENLAIQKGCFKKMRQFISQEKSITNNLSMDSISTYVLFNSKNIRYQTELQWRLSFPIAIFIATLIALAFCKLHPRQSRYSKIIPALLVFIIYFNLLSLSKSWINQGILPLWIGLWWVHLIFAFFTLLILKKHNGPIRIK